MIGGGWAQQPRRGGAMEKTDLKALAAIALLYLAIESLGVTCPILYLTGIACAGCGMSRAWQIGRAHV